MSAASKRPGRKGKIAGIPEYAAVEFKGLGADITDDMGTREQWMERAALEWATTYLAVAILRDDHEELARKVTEAPEVFQGFSQELVEWIELLRGKANLLESIHLRLLAGMARHVVAAGAA